jgi:hypothetical protein
MWWLTRLAGPVMSRLILLPLYHRVPEFSRLFMNSSHHSGPISNEEMMVATHRSSYGWKALMQWSIAWELLVALLSPPWCHAV